MEPAMSSSARMAPSRSRRLPTLLLCVTTGLLAACASRTPSPPAPLPVVHRINVLPVRPIERLYTENKGIPVGALWQALADRIKSNSFTELMDETRKNMGPRMTAALVRRLKEQGFEARVLDGVDRPAKSPEDIDYARIPGDDPVLHVHFYDVGMYSSRFSLAYKPRVNVGVAFLRPRDEDYLYSESIYYGADADAGPPTSGSVPADERHVWTSFDEMVRKSDDVARSYEDAVDTLAARIATNIRARTTLN
ncbi:hypothetical protein [Variovorax sp. PvP013]|uniref:hypothetical protein n=1 Tax=Variovorax sp. PvP013 TaxID=3156435 RepID=UPI003D1D8B1C